MSHYINLNHPMIVESMEEIRREQNLRLCGMLNLWTPEMVQEDMKRIYANHGKFLFKNMHPDVKFNEEEFDDPMRIAYRKIDKENSKEAYKQRMQTEEECAHYFDSQKPRRFPIMVENSRFNEPSLVSILNKTRYIGNN